ncbi:MAG TPA: flagellar motor protein MotB [Sphingomonas sp.]|jgi:chemotaxis protein MotB|nr:flagellar motor protein MotB [Sphingomonas sp.]
MAGANTRPIIIKKVKKVAGGHHGGAWKVAYADFVTAMMAFFMLLWLISNPDKQRLKGLAEYFSPSAAIAMSQSDDAASSSKGVGGMPGAGGHTRRAQSSETTPSKGQPAAEAGSAGVARGGTAAVPDASMRVLAQEMRIAIDSLPPEDETRHAMTVQESRDGLRISLADTDKRSMFRSGTAVLNPYARDMLARVAGKLVTASAQIGIEGHTDGTGGGDSAWRLSGDRALAARAAMIAAGLAPGRFSEIIAMADTQPVYVDQPDRAENRRITIVVKGAVPVLPTDASFRF